MISQIRKVVAGPKKCIKWEEQELDFTYITDSVAAMAFPASGLEKTYRNSIKDVSKFLEEKHKDVYLIINVSNRSYDTELFHKKVNDYVWEDHQAPTLDVLFTLSNDAYNFLGNLKKRGIVCFHCNHGKGRTGTAIICFLIYMGFFKNWEEALKFYNKKRFSGEDYGVSQPCQLRYLYYFNQIIISKKQETLPIKFPVFRLSSLSVKGLQKDYYFNISSTRTSTNKHVKVPLSEEHINSQIPLMCDIYLEVCKKNWTGEKVIARANINLNFITKKNNNGYSWTMKGNEVRVSKSHHNSFEIEFIFKLYCSCHFEANSDCLCEYERKFEQQMWERVHKLAQRSIEIPINESCNILFKTNFKDL